MKSLARAANIGILIGIVAATAAAQVPPEIAAQLRQIGTGVCVPETAKIYAPLQQHAPYAGVTVVRDISYAQDPRTIMDVFAPEKGGGNRPVLIYVSGGGGDKKVNGPDGDASLRQHHAVGFEEWNDRSEYAAPRRFGRWRTGVGRTGERCGPRGRLGADEHQDVQGQPEPHFFWSDSAGNGPVSTYAAHPEIQGANGAAVKGVILMSPPNFNILPETVPAAARGATATPIRAAAERSARRAAVLQVKVAEEAEAEPAEVAGAPGGGAPGGAGRGGPGGGAAAQQPVDQATQLARSNLPGLTKGKIVSFSRMGRNSIRPISGCLTRL